MIRRSLSAAALVGALVVSPYAVAKPPDLPENETITVTPKDAPSPEFDVISGPRPMREPKSPDSALWNLILHSLAAPVSTEPLYDTLPDAVPTPTLYQLRPTARRTLVGSILLGLNPVLGWLPIEKALDAPHDHPQRVAGDDLFRDMPKVNESLVSPGPCEEIDWFKWLMALWSARYSLPAPEQHEGYVQATDDVTCPYLRQQMTDRHACQFADPQIGSDVLDNLERLKQADDLIATAKALARDGCLGEAMECCVLAQELCPGSSSADRAAAVLFDLCFGFDKPARDAEEAAEEQQPDTPAESRSQGESFWEWLAQWIGWPINVYDTDPNRRILESINNSEEMDFIEANWERIWLRERPSSSKAEAGVEQQVDGLMKACRVLVNQGLHEQAAEIARQAYMLDPQRVLADPLLYKMHLLADTPRSHESSEASELPSCPYCPRIGQPIRGIVPEKKKSESGSATLLVPPMPPVDYEVVPVLDRVLTESADTEEASEEEEPASLSDLIETIIDGVGIDANGGLRLSGEWSCGGSVYHLRYHRGCLAIWTTPNAAKVEP